jgi:hypothetical protein
VERDFKRKRGDQMKSLSVKLGVILIGLVIFSCAEVWGADWRYYAKSEWGDYYYDAETVDRLPNNTVRVWTKEISSQKRVVNIVSKLGKEFSDLGYINILYEVDCIGKKRCTLSAVYYSKSKSMIFDTGNERDEWKIIVPGSMGEALFKIICK